MFNLSTFTLENQTSRIKVTPSGGQVLAWQTKSEDGVWRDQLYVGSTQRRSGIPVLFPFANPLRNNIFERTGRYLPPHGFGRDVQWQVVNQTNLSLAQPSITFGLRATDLSPEMRLAYDFDFQAWIKLELGNKRLVYNLLVENLGHTNLPIAPGLHPYFPVSHTQKSTLKIEGLAGFEAQKFAWETTGTGEFYDFPSTFQLQTDKVNLLMTDQSRIRSFRHLVVWSQDLTYPDHDFVCLEPFTRSTNGLNDDPIVVASGQNWEVNWILEAI
jgi:galactose mutarotase-like enzyme